MLRFTPPGEDPTRGTRALPITINSAGTPPGEDGLADPASGLENSAAYQAAHPEGVEETEQPHDVDFLRLVQEAEDQAGLYSSQVNRQEWAQAYRAFHNEHNIGSKYTRPEWRGRSNLFVPKTRGAIRKDNAAVAASLFNSMDAITCVPGNDGDPVQRASAAVMQELVNYRTDRTSGKASLPWFLLAMGARQDAVLTGVCLSKQCWKQEYRKTGTERVSLENRDGVYVETERDTYSLTVDRPDMLLVAAENFIIDPGADWTNPCQSAAYLIIKWPMQVDEIVEKQNAPVNPWNEVPVSVLQASTENASFDSAAIRRSREQGVDRFDETATGQTFRIVWVYETYMRVNGEDYTFYSIGSKAFLTDPKPVREAYPEQDGERPLAMGYGSLEAHRIYPMSPATSWQPLQQETNDIRNLMLDATKQNVMPITKIKRGRQVDLEQVRRRSAGGSIMVNDPEDVTWETPPQMGQGAVLMSRELDLEIDDLSGTQNYGSVETNNALGKTLGGLKLAAGAANAVQEFDIRLWIETWATPALAQIVRLEQYYESDPIVLGLCGQRAQLWQKHGLNSITDHLLEQEVTVRISVGLGAGDPQQRLAKFEAAAKVVAPLLAETPEFKSGQVELDWEAVCTEVFGAAGYRDGGKRFFKENPAPPQNPMADLQQQKLVSEITKNDRTGKAATLNALAALGKVALGTRELEAEVVDSILSHQANARDMGFRHGAQQNRDVLTALDHGHRHGLGVAQLRHQTSEAARQAARDVAGSAPGGGAEIGAPGAGGDPGAGSPAAAASAGDTGTGPQAPSSAPPPTVGSPDPIMELLRAGKIEFTRDPHSGRINGLKLPDAEPSRGAQGYPVPQEQQP